MNDECRECAGNGFVPTEMGLAPCPECEAERLAAELLMRRLVAALEPEIQCPF